jgi:hypothetical protein
MTIEFGALTKHGTMQFVPDYPLAFDDKGAEEYFVAAGFAAKSDKKAKHTYEEGTIEIDPNTIHYESGIPISAIIEHGSVEKANKAGITRASVASSLVVQDVEGTGVIDNG